MPAALVAALLASATAVAPPASAIDGLPLGALPPQPLPAKGCAAYLFTTGTTKALAATYDAETGRLRIVLDGVVTDLPRVAASGPVALGLSEESDFRGETVTAVLTMTVREQNGLTRGALVPEALLRIDRMGQDGIAVPLAGLVGCGAG